MTTSNGQQVHDLTFKAIGVFICLSFFFMPVGTAPLTLSSLAALAIWLLSGRCCRERADWLGQAWLLPVCALCLLPWLGILWSSAPVDQALGFAERSHYWLFAFLAASAMKSEHTLQSVMVCFISGTTLMAIILCLYFIGIIPESAYLQKFTYHSYITYSLFVVVSILMLAFFYKASTTTVSKLVSAVLMLFLAITITQLKGRSAYLALVVLSPWLFVTMFGRHRLIPLLVAVPVTLALLLSSPRVRERLDLIPKEIKLYQSGGSTSYTATDGSQLESSIGLRLMVWSDALKIFRHYPLFGAGTGAYQHEANKINPENKLPHPHNSYLFILVNYGLLGIGLYGWLLAVTLRRSWRARAQLSGHSILAFLLVILIGSLTDTQVLSAATGIALGFVAGIPTPPTTVCAS